MDRQPLPERLSALRQWLSNQGVSDHLIEQLLLYHTPAQIQMGFRKLAEFDYPVNKIARIVLKGRFGFRRGLKHKRKPPARDPKAPGATRQPAPPATAAATREASRGTPGQESALQRAARKLLEDLGKGSS